MASIECIFIIEDNEMDRWLTHRIVELSGLCQTVETANNGLDALKKLHQFYDRKGKFPDLILVDLQMPLMNGFDFILSLQKLKSFSSEETMIAVLTAELDNQTDINSLHKLGVRNILLKPLDKNEFISLIKK